MTRAEHALRIFDEGCDCGQAILQAFEAGMDADQHELDCHHAAVPLLPGRPDERCGIVSGALTVIGEWRELGDAPDRAAELSARFRERFLAAHASLGCRQLLGYDLTDVRQLGEALDTGAVETVCRRLMLDACALLEELLSPVPAAS